MTDLLPVEPQVALVAVEAQCSSLEAWAAECESVPELRDASNKLAAIDEYLTRTSKEGRARVAAAMRRLEVRIGELLGPAPGRGSTHPGESSHRDESFHPQQEADFRQMAANPDIVEDEIDQSTDERPASRRKVMGAVTAKGTSPSRSPQRKPLIADFLAATIDLDKRVDRIVRLTQDDRFRSNADRIADSYLSHFVRDRDALSDVITYFIETRGSNTP